MIKHAENLRQRGWHVVAIDIMILSVLCLIYLWPLVVGSQEEIVWGKDYYLQYFSPVLSFICWLNVTLLVHLLWPKMAQGLLPEES